ncbi:FAD binding domain-containing protein [bacterium]|nr:FAD binding domain-containing protein [bacterium]
MVDGFRPADLQEALEFRAQHPSIPIAGGTDLMVQKARGFGLKPDFNKPLLFIGHLRKLRQISVRDGNIHIGAGVLLSELLKNGIIPESLKMAVRQMASPPSRNLATIGGNICNASPAGDTLPHLYAVDAKLILKSVSSERIVHIGEFITDPKQNTLGHDELLTKIIIPNKLFNVNYYRKVGQRKGMSLTKAAFLGMADIERDIVTDIRIAFGSVAPKIVRSQEIEKTYIGKPTFEMNTAIPEILAKYAPLIRPIDDARSTAAYREKVSLRLLEDFLWKLC